MPEFSFVFYGTPEFGVVVLDRLEREGRRPIAVVCQPDRPRGRGRKLTPVPVKVWAQKRSIEVLQPARQKDSGYLARLGAIEADVSLVAAFGQILTRQVLQVPRLGFINVHPSRIPRYRGAAPLQWTLINGDEETAVSILKVVPKVDAGDLLAQRVTPVGPNETAVELRDRLGDLGGELAASVLECYERGQTEGEPQDENLVTSAPMLTIDDGRVDWTWTARSIHNRIRGVQPWPGARTVLAGKTFKVHRAAVEREDGVCENPGRVVEARRDRLLVETGRGVLRLLEVQAEGKKRLDVKAFLAGSPLQAGDALG